MPVISINVTDEQAQQLDEMAGHWGRSKWVRQAITRAYAHKKQRAADTRPANPGRKAATPRGKRA